MVVVVCLAGREFGGVSSRSVQMRHVLHSPAPQCGWLTLILGAAVISLAGCGDNPSQPQEVTLSTRRGHTMVYDEARRQLLLFGGWGPEGAQPAGDRNSLWQWDGQRWSQLSSSGPSARHDPALTYDVARQRVVLFG